MIKKSTFYKYAFTTIACLFVIIQISEGQGAKKAKTAAPAAKAGAKPAAKVDKKKVPVKATIVADIDCTVKINGAVKAIDVKAFKAMPVVLMSGENTLEAVTLDKKSTFKKTVDAAAGSTPAVEFTFLSDNKFLEYIKEGNIAMVESAIKKNPSLASLDSSNLAASPLEIAIENSRVDIINLLISKGTNYSTLAPFFPLHKSVMFASSEKLDKDKYAPDRELVDCFLNKGGQITDKDDGGNTPLHIAAQAGKLDLVIFFVEKGADVLAKNNTGETPLKIAEDKGYISIIDYLKPKVAALKVAGTVQEANGK